MPVLGARTRDQLAGVLAALDKPLTPQELAELERLVPREAAAGQRYGAAMMVHLDSER